MLNIDMDIVKVIQNRSLSYFGPVVRMNSGHYCMDMSMGPDRKEDQEKDVWITLAKAVKFLVYHCQLLKDLPMIDLFGGLQFTT